MSFVLRNLYAGYGASAVLRGIDLDLAPGAIVCISGRNGAGKSTLIRAIAGLTPARADTISLGGRSLATLTPERRFALGVTLVPQGHRTFASLSVRENLALAARVRGERPWTLDALCDRIPIVGSRYAQRAGTLSGGETQLVLVARALAGNGTLLLMDEPAEGLDARATLLLQYLVRETAERGAAIVVTEQRTAYLDAIGARPLALIDGLIGERRQSYGSE